MSINEMWEKLVEHGDGVVLCECVRVAIVDKIKDSIKYEVQRVVDLSKAVCCPDSVHQEESSID